MQLISLGRVLFVAGSFLSLSGVLHAQQGTVPTVGILTAERSTAAETMQFVGRVEAVEHVDIRARVTGYLTSVLFKDGEQVKVGTPLYRIERGPFEAAVQQGWDRYIGATGRFVGMLRKIKQLKKTLPLHCQLVAASLPL